MIAGGVPAVTSSWPAQVLVLQNYQGYVTILGTKYIVTGQVVCGGTIIDAYTIITAASCIYTSFSYYGYLLQSVSLFYPTLESMFTIYAGVTSLSSSPNAVRLSVKKVLRVNKFLLKQTLKIKTRCNNNILTL